MVKNLLTWRDVIADGQISLAWDREVEGGCPEGAVELSIENVFIDLYGET